MQANKNVNIFKKKWQTERGKVLKLTVYIAGTADACAVGSLA
jgi:hypothetical protein